MFLRLCNTFGMPEKHLLWGLVLTFLFLFQRRILKGCICTCISLVRCNCSTKKQKRNNNNIFFRKFCCIEKELPFYKVRPLFGLTPALPIPAGSIFSIAPQGYFPALLWEIFFLNWTDLDLIAWHSWVLPHTMASPNYAALHNSRVWNAFLVCLLFLQSSYVLCFLLSGQCSWLTFTS